MTYLEADHFEGRECEGEGEDEDEGLAWMSCTGMTDHDAIDHTDDL